MRTGNQWLRIERDPELWGRNYIGMFDLAKGLFMMGAILQHCANHYVFVLGYTGSGAPLLLRLLLSPLTLLRYGEVPMLFMICGYGIRRQPIKKNVASLLKQLIFPYVSVMIFVTLAVLLQWTIEGGNLTGELHRQVLPFLLGFHPGGHRLDGTMGQIGPVWFFFTYVFAAIWLNLVLQEKRGWVQLLLLGSSTAAGLFFVGLKFPFCLQQIGICSGFMYVGMKLKQGKIPQQKIPLAAGLLVLVACSGGTALGGLAEIGNNIYGFGGLDLLLAYLAGVLCVCLHLRLNVLQGRIADGLRWIGRHMMWFCCAHTITYLTVPWKRAAAFWADRPLVGMAVESAFSLAFAIGLCLLADWAGRKIFAMKYRLRAGSTEKTG